MVLDDRFAAARDEDEMLDSGLPRLVHHVLDQRPVDHRQHLLRHGLGRWQEPGSKAGDRENGFADAGHSSLKGGAAADSCADDGRLRVVSRF